MYCVLASSPLSVASGEVSEVVAVNVGGVVVGQLASLFFLCW